MGSHSGIGRVLQSHMGQDGEWEVRKGQEENWGVKAGLDRIFLTLGRSQALASKEKNFYDNWRFCCEVEKIWKEKNFSLIF